MNNEEIIKYSFNFKNTLKEYIINKTMKDLENDSFIKDTKCPPACPTCCGLNKKNFTELNNLLDFRDVCYELISKNELSNKINNVSLENAVDILFNSLKRLMIDDNLSLGKASETEIKIINDWFNLCPFYYGKCAIYDFISRPLLCKTYHCKKEVNTCLEDNKLVYEFFKEQVMPLFVSNERKEAVFDWYVISRWSNGLKGKELKEYLTPKPS